MLAYYNENDAYCVEWLGNLACAGLISGGEIDGRDIQAVVGEDVWRFQRAHFFAGIGGWDVALNLAGWPPERHVWTGSCPCQPFSAAGRRRAEKDARHLWPEFRRLITECRPPTVFGEQVASKAGRIWLSRVRADLEALGYAVGAADLPAAGVGAPHIRQRLWWVAHAQGKRRDRGEDTTGETGRRGAENGGGLHGMAHSGGEGLALGSEQPAWGEREAAQRGGNAGGLGNAIRPGDANAQPGAPAQTPSRMQGEDGQRQRVWSDPWQPSDTVPCLDGKARRIEPELEPVADGISARVGRLRAYGNAIVPQVAAEFIGAFMEAERAS